MAERLQLMRCPLEMRAAMVLTRTVIGDIIKECLAAYQQSGKILLQVQPIDGQGQA